MSLKTKTQNISIVLYKPKYAGNVGSIARVAKNMGISRIVVVGAPDLNREDMDKRATHLASDVLDGIVHADTIEEALGDFNYIVGTTARQGKARGPFASPRAVAADIAELSRKNRVALLFGPEDAGLANDQLRLCHRVVTIPTSREFTSLNLSHAVMILCYELFVAQSTATISQPKRALSSELEGMYAQIKDLLDSIGFLNVQNPEYWMLDIRRFFSRSGLMSREVKIIRGICRQIQWSIENKKT